MKQGKEAKECNDKKCPFHGSLSLRGRTLTGIIVNTDVHRSATIEVTRLKYIKKYERYEKRRKRIRVHNPPCISAIKGELVKVIESKPISKTKHFVVIEKLGKDILFKQKEELIEESKYKQKEQEKKKEKQSEHIHEGEKAE